jgi:O-antigen/teichoic acid export membrane protein
MSRQPSHRQTKLFGWISVLARFTSAQLVIQVLGFLSGILIVQNLSKPDYAWFTIANTFAATIGMLADVGVSGAVTAIGGEVWQDKSRFGSLIRTALTFRRKLAIVSVTAVTPIFIWMLAKNQAPVATISVVVPAALAGFLMQLTAGVLGVVISLRQDIRRMQLLGLAPALLRLAILAPACLIFIDSRIAVITGAIGFALQVWILRRWVKNVIEWNAPESPDYRGRILSIVKRQAPNTIFQCVQGQIIILLISIFGNEHRVAEIGALGRFAIVFTLISSVVNGVVVPRFVRCQDPGVLRRRYWQVAFVFTVLAGLLVALSAVFPHPLLWLIGAKYANLESEVWLMMLNAALGSLLLCLVSLTYFKGWIIPAAILIPLEIATQLILILSFDMSTVHGVLMVGVIATVPPILLNMIIAHLKTRNSPATSSPLHP